VAGLRPDPLGELQCSPRPLASKGGLLLRAGKGREGKAFRQINICHYTTVDDRVNVTLIVAKKKHEI